jgi:hypothetical protein
MFLKVTERNMWEQEAWSHIIDVSKQEASSLNFLMIFVRLANEQFEVDKEKAKRNGHAHCFASSRYQMEFYDSYKEEKIGERSRILLTHKNSNLSIFTDGGSYKSSGLMLDRVISSGKMKSAMLAMRDKKQNSIYKNFESIFLKKSK